MGPPAARPSGADLDALLSKQTVQGRARTERYNCTNLDIAFAFLSACLKCVLPMLLGNLLCSLLLVDQRFDLELMADCMQRKKLVLSSCSY